MILLILSFVWFTIWYFILSNKFSESTYIKSEFDKNIYHIRGGKSKSTHYLKNSANILAEINLRILKLIDYLDSKYDSKSNKYYFIKLLKENYKPQILSEGALDHRFTTYTVDKNDMHICLRTRDSKEEIYDINILMYVIIHELAHLCNYDTNNKPIYGHGSEFKYKFRFLLMEAIKCGVYEYTNYEMTPKEYCGITINTTILPEEQLSLI